jgi:hypothetical protein
VNQLHTQFGAQPRTGLVGQLGCRLVTVVAVPGRVAAVQLLPEQARAGVGLPVGPAQPDRVTSLLLGRVRAEQGEPLSSQRMQALAEQELHLLGSHRVAGPQSFDAGQARTEPDAGRLTLLVVVVGQGSAHRPDRVVAGDLPGQVVIARPRGQLLHPHHRDHLLPPVQADEPAIGGHG